VRLHLLQPDVFEGKRSQRLLTGHEADVNRSYGDVPVIDRPLDPVWAFIDFAGEQVKERQGEEPTVRTVFAPFFRYSSRLYPKIEAAHGASKGTLEEKMISNVKNAHVGAIQFLFQQDWP